AADDGNCRGRSRPVDYRGGKMSAKARRPRPLPRGVLPVEAVMRATWHSIPCRNPASFGSALARLRRASRMSVAEQASGLGLSPWVLADLALLQRPRPDHREADMAVVSERVGLAGDVL